MSTIRMILAIVFIAAVTALVVSLCSIQSAAAAGLDQSAQPPTPDCTTCHSEVAQLWKSGKHANAFSDSAFKTAWDEGENQKYCLTCHTTNYDANTDQFVQEGVGCVACHKQAGTQTHPGGAGAMTVSDSAEFCGTCHTTTLHEWQKGGHGKANIACQSCHDMHSTSLRTASSDDLCSNCHKERNVQANMPMSGLTQCANCHMFTPVEDKTEGKGATGHSFVMSSDACQKCHKDNIHAAHNVDPTALPQPGMDKSITPPSPEPAQPLAQAAAAVGSSNLAGIVGGALGGMLLGFAAAVVTVRRNQ